MLRSLIKRSLPSGLVELLGDLSRVEPPARTVLVRRALGRWLGAERAPVPAPTAPGQILTVCHGNILRSAYAEVLLRRAVTEGRLRPIRIRSAGLHARAGKPADPRGVEVAREQGHDLDRHTATPLDPTLVAEAALILIMDRRNEAELLARHPDAAPKLLYLGSFAPAADTGNVIADPYTGDTEAVRATFRRLEAAVDGLIRALTAAETSQWSPGSQVLDR